MSKLDDAVKECTEQMEKCKIACDGDLLRAIAKSIGPSIYNKDAKLVAASDKKEVETIKKNFIAKKLGVEGPDADAAIADAVQKIGSKNRRKLRPVFYYLIVKNLKKEAVFS